MVEGVGEDSLKKSNIEKTKSWRIECAVRLNAKVKIIQERKGEKDEVKKSINAELSLVWLSCPLCMPMDYFLLYSVSSFNSSHLPFAVCIFNNAL